MGVRPIVAVALAASLAGCSFTIYGPDPNAPASVPPKCEDWAVGRYVLDGLGTTYWGIWSLVFAAFAIHGGSAGGEIGPQTDLERVGFGGIAAGLAGVATLHVLAIRTGRRHTRTCRDAKRAYRQWQERRAAERKASQRRRAAELKRFCNAHVEQWRGASNDRIRVHSYDAMPEKCRSLVVAPSKEQRARVADCDRVIEVWRKMQDEDTKARLYESMRPDCRKTMTSAEAPDG